MAWYIDSKNVKKNTNEKANAKYEKFGNQEKNLIMLAFIDAVHVVMKI